MSKPDTIELMLGVIHNDRKAIARNRQVELSNDPGRPNFRNRAPRTRDPTAGHYTTFSAVSKHGRSQQPSTKAMSRK